MRSNPSKRSTRGMRTPSIIGVNTVTLGTLQAISRSTPTRADTNEKTRKENSMSTNIDQTIAQRGNRYGSFADNAAVCQGFKDYARQCPSWEAMSPDQREAFDNMFLKMGRILTGDPDYIDNWHDLQGYPALVEERLLLEKSQKSKYPTRSGELT